MKFTVSSAELLKALMDVSKAIPAKSVQPILENFLFVLKDNNLEITASDSDLTLRTCIQVEKVQEEGSIAVPARHFTDLLKALPDQPVSIKTTDEGASFECSWSSGVSTLPFFPAEDYPHIKTVDDDARKVVFPAQTLLDGINGTIYATTLMRLAILPVGIHFLFLALGWFSPFVIGINTVVIAMPVATYGTILCLRHGKDTSLITEVTFITTLLSMISIPLLVTWLL